MSHSDTYNKLQSDVERVYDKMYFKRTWNATGSARDSLSSYCETFFVRTNQTRRLSCRVKEEDCDVDKK